MNLLTPDEMVLLSDGQLFDYCLKFYKEQTPVNDRTSILRIRLGEYADTIRCLPIKNCQSEWNNYQTCKMILLILDLIKI